MKPICVPCERYMRPHKTGVSFIEGMPRAGLFASAEPGKRNTDAWEPYKLWHGDRWQCPDCKATIIVGVAQRPLREQHDDDFRDVAARLGATLIVKDC